MGRGHLVHDRRGPHAGAPYDRGGVDPLAVGERHASQVQVDHPGPQVGLHAELAELRLRLGREIRRKGGEQASARLDEVHPRPARVDVAEVARERDL